LAALKTAVEKDSLLRKDKAEALPDQSNRTKETDEREAKARANASIPYWE
jgi:hypothetical protein